MTKQPEYKLIGNLGDVNPLDHGGKLVYVDTTGVYDPCMEVIEPNKADGEILSWTVYRFNLEKCTFTDGIVSDNKFHPLHSAWFAKPESEKVNRPQDTTYLSNVASYGGVEVDELIEWLCSDFVINRAEAYDLIASYHGMENFDSYPLTLNRAEVEERYKDGFKPAN
jgi:hypothetical protein